jgi:hypothetical protein
MQNRRHDSTARTREEKEDRREEHTLQEFSRKKLNNKAAARGQQLPVWEFRDVTIDNNEHHRDEEQLQEILTILKIREQTQHQQYTTMMLPWEQDKGRGDFSQRRKT